MARGAGAFAQGLVQGFVQGKKLQQEQERHELEMARLREDRALAEEMKQARADVKPAKAFEVVAPTGERQMFADEAAAKEAATAMEGADILPFFMVGEQRFDSQEQAQAAAEMMNSPAAKARRQAETALKFNRPELARQHQEAWKAMIQANRYETNQRFLEARGARDYDAVAAVLNGNGRVRGIQVELAPDGRGNVVQRWLRNGEVVGERVVPEDTFWDQAALQLSEAPDNMFEHVKFREGLRQRAWDERMQERRFDHQVRTDTAQLGIAGGNLALRGQELEFNRAKALNPQPAAIQTVDPITGQGQVTFVSQQGVYEPGRGLQWAPQVSQPQSVGGMPASTYNMLNRPQQDLLGLGMDQPQPLIIDWSKVPPRSGGVPPPAASPTQPPPGASIDEYGNWTSGSRAGGLIAPR